MAAGSSSPQDYGSLKELVRHHIESFDYMKEYGLERMFREIKAVEVFDSFSKEKLRIFFGEPELFQPQKERSTGTYDALYPFECRQAKLSYTGKFKADICFQYGDRVPIRETYNFGQFPVMLKSKLCHLRGANKKKLLACKEELSEAGGYFILNGLEKVVRLLILPKRNYPMSTIRSSFRDRREGYTDKAVVMRCVRDDQSAVTVTLYYLSNGSARFGFWIQGREFLIPVGILLKAFVDTTDHEIYVGLTSCYDEKYLGEKGSVGTHLVGERAKIILDEVRDMSFFTRSQCLNHIGKHLQSVMDGLKNESYSTVAEAVLKDYIFVHLENNQDKFNLLIFMLQKLFSLIDHTSLEDNPDALQNQEVLLPGHLITLYLKEKMQEWLLKIKGLLEEELRNKSKNFDITSLEDVKKVIDKNPTKLIGYAIENLLKTGRINCKSGMDLRQRAAFTVMAERINFLRFISHFRAVHRGSAFDGLRTTSVRKLLPESWGFICPVNTPDGTPCGLLNHMTSCCSVTSYYDSQGRLREFFNMRKSILSVLIGIGMSPLSPKLVQAGLPKFLSVLLDGTVVGCIPVDIAEKAVNHLRKLKLSSASMIPEDLEVGYVPLSMGGAYPGFYLFTSPSRFVRPVRNISFATEPGHDTELIGPFEQVYMEIRCADGGDGGRRNNSPATHEEIHPTGILSVVGNLTPWSDHNQSPRNMYQCQMAKQTMGFSAQTINCRADQKLYHLQTPQSPIVRTKTYVKYNIDEFPLGTNAIVAVLAYSGYDMEDAMILNKSSVERGMCYGQIYQTQTIDLDAKSGKPDHVPKHFRRSNLDKSTHSVIDTDGLPFVGQKLNDGDPYYSIYNEVTGESRTYKFKGKEPVVVDFVSVDVKSKKHLTKANIRLRHDRTPIIGDKFSSRHGQKGVCSQLWADNSMPFAATGMRPDLIINPHAFPSRMTIAMLLESIAAKGGALSGKFVDATPFEHTLKKGESESKSLVDEIGSILGSRGFNYYGTEVLYSGVYGDELTCEIFFGPVYYQRLRHMVLDKYQVRSTGTYDNVTRQPIKGRKLGGGVRFGEMERDSLLAHGAAYLLHDRLHTCSDRHIADVCTLCGSILTSSIIHQKKRTVREIGGLPPGRAPKKVVCISCNTSEGMEEVAMPYVFRYLAAELAAMNIKLNLQISGGGRAGA